MVLQREVLALAFLEICSFYLYTLVPQQLPALARNVLLLSFFANRTRGLLHPHQVINDVLSMDEFVEADRPGYSLDVLEVQAREADHFEKG